MFEKWISEIKNPGQFFHCGNFNRGAILWLRQKRIDARILTPHGDSFKSKSKQFLKTASDLAVTIKTRPVFTHWKRWAATLGQTWKGNTGRRSAQLPSQTGQNWEASLTRWTTTRWRQDSPTIAGRGTHRWGGLCTGPALKDEPFLSFKAIRRGWSHRPT